MNNEIKVIRNGKELNVLHFCGRSLKEFPSTTKLIGNYIKLDNNINPDLTIVSCWTDDAKCMLYQQLKNNGIKLHNCLPKTYNKWWSKWHMPNKIHYILSYLINHVTTKYVLILDGYDVLMTNTNTIIDKFLKQKYRVLFNATPNNFPDETIDIVPGREELGRHRYFNAGCCIGYREDLIKFYAEALEYMELPNPLNSEQKVLRHVFANYSEDPNQTFVGFETTPDIFLAMPLSTVKSDPETNTIQIYDTEESLIK